MFEGFHSYRRFRARMQLLLAVPPSRFDAPATTGALRDAIRELSDAGYPTTAIREMMLSGVERMVRDNCGSAGQRDALLYWIEASIDDECARHATRPIPELPLGASARRRATPAVARSAQRVRAV